MNTSQFLALRSNHPVTVLPPCDQAAIPHYNVPGRAYHTWVHVVHVYECSRALLRHSEAFDLLDAFEKESLVLAISWHDVFQGPNHELASAAKLYQERPGETSALAAHLIVEGTTHLATPAMASLSKVMGMPAPTSRNFEILGQTIHDADLMILAEDPGAYDNYAREIVVEALAFGLGLTDYRDRRIQFLRHIESVAEKHSLFKTEAAQQLNSSVLENVRRELKGLLP